MSFVLRDVICPSCNDCRDLDLCRDPHLQVAIPHLPPQDTLLWKANTYLAHNLAHPDLNRLQPTKIAPSVVGDLVTALSLCCLW